MVGATVVMVTVMVAELILMVVTEVIFSETPGCRRRLLQQSPAVLIDDGHRSLIESVTPDCLKSANSSKCLSNSVCRVHSSHRQRAL